MAGEDPEHLARIRALPCCIGVECEGPVEAHHSTGRGRGMSQKNHDHCTMPLCHKHHHELHRACGHFRGLTRQDRQHWQELMVEQYRPKKLPDVF